MHIGLYTECLTKPYTGVEHATITLIRGLRQTKHKTTCFHSKDPKHPKIRKVNHHLFSKPLPVPFYHRLASIFRSSCFNDLDVLHLQHPQLPYFKKPNIPVVMTVHDIIPVFYPEFHNAKRVFFFRHVLPSYLRNADAIIASSNSTKRDLVKYYGLPEAKIKVIYPALPQKETTKKSKRENFILYIGTLEPRKNLEGVIKAFSILKSKGYPQKLVIAGRKGWDYQNIFKTIKRLNLQNEVIYKGYVSEKEKQELYEKASLFVWPSFYEGFGLPVLEAMAYGVPVVTSNTSSLPEVVGDAGILVNPHNPEDIAAGMIKALKEPEKLAKKGLKRAKQFALKHMIKQTLAVYEEVIRN